MKIPKAFLPEKRLEEKIDYLTKAEPYYPGALAISVGFAYSSAWASDIMVWIPGMESPETVASRMLYVQALCVYENMLYDAGEYKKVIDTLNGKVVAERDYHISSLCVHNGIMYDGGLRKIFRTDDGRIVARREGWVKALCSHNGELYDAGSYGAVFRTFDNYSIAKKNEWTYALCSNNNRLYDASSNRVVDTFRNKTVAKRKALIMALSSFNNTLYDAGYYSGVYETSKKIFFKKKLFKIGAEENIFRGITAIQPISLWLANKLLQRAPQ